MSCFQIGSGSSRLGTAATIKGRCDLTWKLSMTFHFISDFNKDDKVPFIHVN